MSTQASNTLHTAVSQPAPGPAGRAPTQVHVARQVIRLPARAYAPSAGPSVAGQQPFRQVVRQQVYNAGPSSLVSASASAPATVATAAVTAATTAAAAASPQSPASSSSSSSLSSAASSSSSPSSGSTNSPAREPAAARLPQSLRRPQEGTLPPTPGWGIPTLNGNASSSSSQASAAPGALGSQAPSSSSSGAQAWGNAAAATGAATGTSLRRPVYLPGPALQRRVVQVPASAVRRDAAGNPQVVPAASGARGSRETPPPADLGDTAAANTARLSRLQRVPPIRTDVDGDDGNGQPCPEESQDITIEFVERLPSSVSPLRTPRPSSPLPMRVLEQEWLRRHEALVQEQAEVRRSQRTRLREQLLRQQRQEEERLERHRREDERHRRIADGLPVPPEPPQHIKDALIAEVIHRVALRGIDELDPICALALLEESEWNVDIAVLDLCGEDLEEEPLEDVFNRISGLISEVGTSEEHLAQALELTRNARLAAEESERLSGVGTGDSPLHDEEYDENEVPEILRGWASLHPPITSSVDSIDFDGPAVPESGDALDGNPAAEEMLEALHLQADLNFAIWRSIDEVYSGGFAEPPVDEDILNRISERRRFDATSDEAGRCAVCLEDYEEQSWIRILPCRHLFHSICVDKWLRQSAQCPTCKAKVGSKDQQETPPPRPATYTMAYI